jgi:hypothetical protein
VLAALGLKSSTAPGTCCSCAVRASSARKCTVFVSFRDAWHAWSTGGLLIAVVTVQSVVGFIANGLMMIAAASLARRIPAAATVRRDVRASTGLPADPPRPKIASPSLLPMPAISAAGCDRWLAQAPWTVLLRADRVLLVNCDVVSAGGQSGSPGVLLDCRPRDETSDAEATICGRASSAGGRLVAVSVGAGCYVRLGRGHQKLQVGSCLDDLTFAASVL